NHRTYPSAQNRGLCPGNPRNSNAGHVFPARGDIRGDRSGFCHGRNCRPEHASSSQRIVIGALVICAGDSLPDGGATEVEVAIVGAGPIGLAVATRLLGRVGRIALIEAGSTQFKAAQSFEFSKAAHINDSRHLPTGLNRRRMLGGTTSIWGGRCIPLDPEDFAPTHWRPGWPITYGEMDAHIAE